MCALAGVAVTSRVVFDHQPPSQPEDVVTYLATLGATVIAGWWFANVLAWAVALRRGVHLDRFTLPGTKRIAQIVLAATLSTSCVADANDDPVMVLVEQVTDSSPTTALPTATTAPPDTAPPTTAPPTTAPPTTADESLLLDGGEPDQTVSSGIVHHQVVVSEGDNLWSLAAETLELSGIEAPTCGQIAQYWQLVVAANQVRSGNPDLIAIGEAVTMPAFDLTTLDMTTSGIVAN